MTATLDTLLKHTSRSLYLSARLLPAGVRETFAVAYLLCRYADSIADTALLPSARRLQWVERYPSMITAPDEKTQQELIREISGSSSNPYEQELLLRLPDCLREFDKLNQRHRACVMEVVRQVCAGMETDLRVFPPENAAQVKAFSSADDLENYCHKMGGAPGIFWSELIEQSVALRAESSAFLTLGRDVGDALQIVNILRDLPRDLRIGRCYFPADELRAHGLCAQDLLQTQNAARFEPVKQKWIAWGARKLQSAKPYFAALPKTQLKHRAAVAWPVLWAADTLRRLSEETDLLNVQRKVKIPRARIYYTMALTPPLLLSNAAFNAWLDLKTKRISPRA